MKKLFILLVILILESCQPDWNNKNTPLVITGVYVYSISTTDTLYKYTMSRSPGSMIFRFKSHNFYNISDTVEIKTK